MTENYKGIILAGGSGTRLHPITNGVSKQLLPVYDKPMIYYPLSVLMLAGIRDILIISTPDDIDQYKNLLGNGDKFGVKFTYKIQPNPDGIAQAFLIGEEFIGSSKVAMILGDNIFFGQYFSSVIEKAIKNNTGATVFGFHVDDPQRFGVVSFDDDGKVINIEEKPNRPKSNYAITGLYLYNNDVVEITKTLKPSDRGELEITDINNIYQKKNNLKVEILGRGFAWLDTGTEDSLLQASQFIKTIQKRQGLYVACIEEIALKNGWIELEAIKKIANTYKNNQYGNYLKSLIKKK